MKKMGLLWRLYFLFFAIPFPMILYYSISGHQPQPAHSSPAVVQICLVLSVLLWLLGIFLLCKRWIWGVFKMQDRIKWLTTQGVQIPARITDCVSTGPSAGKNAEPLEVVFVFANFAGAMVTERMQINDSKPYERRYEVGKTMNLRLDPDIKPPYLLPEDTRTQLRTGVLALRASGIALFVLAIIGYYFFSYRYEGHQVSWNFLVFWHPLILCALMTILFIVFNIGRIGSILVGGKHNLRLKFYGKKTKATLRNATQTGLTINNQPQVLFEIEYEDDLGKKYQVKFKKIVSLLNLDMAREKELMIFYLPDEPHTIAFASDLES